MSVLGEIISSELWEYPKNCAPRVETIPRKFPWTPMDAWSELSWNGASVDEFRLFWFATGVDYHTDIAVGAASNFLHADEYGSVVEN